MARNTNKPWKRIKEFFTRQNPKQFNWKDFIIDFINTLSSMYVGLYIGHVFAEMEFKNILKKVNFSYTQNPIFLNGLNDHSAYWMRVFPFLRNWEERCTGLARNHFMQLMQNVQQQGNHSITYPNQDLHNQLRRNVFRGGVLEEDTRQPWEDFQAPSAVASRRDSDEVCSICQESLYDAKNPSREHFNLICCNNKVHVDCGNRWWKAQRRHVDSLYHLPDPLPMTCPLCRKLVDFLQGGPSLFPMIFPETKPNNIYKRMIQNSA